MSNYWS